MIDFDLPEWMEYNANFAEADEVYYRVDAGSIEGSLYCVAFRVLRHTPAGVVIDVYGQEKFILAGSDGKRWAYPTKRAALWSFIKRKRWQAIYARRTLEHATEMQKLAGRIYEEKFK